MNKRALKDVILTCLFGSISFSSFITTLFVLGLKQKVSSPLLISVILLSQKAVKFITDVPFAIYADLRGVRRLFFFSPVLTILCASLMFVDSVYALVAAIVIHGVAISLKMGKIEGRIYNTLKTFGEESSFPRIMSVYFVASNIFIGAFSYFSSIIYSRYGYRGIFFAVCVQSIVAFLCILFMEGFTSYSCASKKSILSLLRESFEFIKKFPVAIAISVLLAFYNFFGWQIIPVVKLYLLEEAIPLDVIMKFGGIFGLVMATGSILSFFICNRVSLKMSFLVWLIEVVVMLLFLLFHRKMTIFGLDLPLFCLGLLIYTFFYSTIEIVAIKSIEGMIPSAARYLLSSFNNIVSVVINVLGNLSIGFLVTPRHGYSFALFVAIAGLVLASVFVYVAMRGRVKS